MSDETTPMLHGMRFGPEGALRTGPATVTIEITTRCNLTCVMCTHGVPGGMPMKRDAPDEMVDMILKSLHTITELHPTGVGEPLMADGFWRIVDALNGKTSPRLVFHTNGMLLTERNVGRLKNVPISRVNVSVDAADEATYRRIRGGDMSKTTEGIRRLAAALKERPANDGVKPSIAMSMVLMRDNIEEAPAFVRLAADLGVRHVYFDHLIEPHVPREHWIVNRGNFRFSYAEQDLHSEPEFADAHVIRALDEADRLGVVVEGYEALLSKANRSHNQRPCRTGAILFMEVA
jgi:MoaA/NifB/PqqE/SkfB family radical SAM enzyme